MSALSDFFKYHSITSNTHILVQDNARSHQLQKRRPKKALPKCVSEPAISKVCRWQSLPTGNSKQNLSKPMRLPKRNTNTSRGSSNSMNRSDSTPELALKMKRIASESSVGKPSYGMSRTSRGSSPGQMQNARWDNRSDSKQQNATRGRKSDTPSRNVRWDSRSTSRNGLDHRRNGSLGMTRNNNPGNRSSSISNAMLMSLKDKVNISQPKRKPSFQDGLRPPQGNLIFKAASIRAQKKVEKDDSTLETASTLSTLDESVASSDMGPRKPLRIECSLITT